MSLYHPLKVDNIFIKILDIDVINFQKINTSIDIQINL